MTETKHPSVWVYAADLSTLQDDRLLQTVRRSVNAYRLDKTERMGRPEDKRRSLGAECLLMYACREADTDYRGATVLAGPYGKPAFADRPLQFSLSHSGERALCCVSEYPVGCDVEKIRPLRRDVAGRYFSAQERRALAECAAQPERDDLFFRLWTLKESFVKCTGLGFSLPFHEFSLILTEETVRVEQNVDGGSYQFFEGPPTAGFRSAWCVRTPDAGAGTRPAEVYFREITLDETLICALTGQRAPERQEL